MLQSFKNFIKSNKFTKIIYAKLQCYAVFLQYKIIKLYYKFKPIKNIKKISKINYGNEKLRVFYFGGDEFQDKSGFLQALENYTELNYFIKEDGSYGSYNFGVLNREKNIKKNRKRLLELLANIENRPHILLMQTWEWRIGLDTLKEIKKLYPDMLLVNIAMDDRHSFWIYGNTKIGSAGLIHVLDAVFTTSSEAVEWYKKEGCPAFFYPLASDETTFYPMEIEKIYDVGFVGAKYGIRELIVNKLKKLDIKVQAFGNRWESGRLPIEDTNKFYNQCKIVLGVGTILGCDNFTSMKLRDFDVPMSGSLYITNYNEDTANIFEEDKEIVFYKDVEECIFKIKKLLEDENKMEKIRINAYNKAKQHTYNQRIKYMIENLGYKI